MTPSQGSDTSQKVLRLTSCLWLLAFFPIETWLSWPALYHPYYLVNVVGMLAMAWGLTLASPLGARAAAVLAAAWAWTAANFWRGTTDRFEAHAAGQALAFGASERWIGVVLTAFLIVMTGLALRVALTHHSGEAGPA